MSGRREDGEWSSVLEAMDKRTNKQCACKKARVITLFKKRTFDYTFLPAAQAKVVVIQRALRVIPFYYYSLLMRVHRATIDNGSFSLAGHTTFPSDEDPQEFTEAASVSVTVNSNSAPSAPFLLTADISNKGPYLKFQITASQAGVATSVLYAELSAALFVRAIG